MGMELYFRRLTWVVYAYVAVCLLTVMALRNVSPQVVVALSYVLPILTGGFAGYAALLAWRKSEAGAARVWGWLCGGMGLWLVAEIVWAVMALIYGNNPPYPSLADVAWFLGYVPIGAALVLFIRQQRLRLTLRRVIFALVGGVVVPVLLFLAFMLPFKDPADPEAMLRVAALVVNAVYPPLDVMLAVLACLCLLAQPEEKIWRRPWLLIGGALALWAYADIWYWVLTFTNSHVLGWVSVVQADVPYTVAYVLLGLGCLLAVHVWQEKAGRSGA